MKIQLKTLFVFLMAAAIAVSCGKNESGGGSDNYTVGGSYGVSQNIDPYSRTTFEKARTWFNNSQDNGWIAPVMFGGIRSFTRANFQVTRNCEIFGIDLGDFCGLLGSNSMSVISGTIKRTCVGYASSGNVLPIKRLNGNGSCTGAFDSTYTKQNNIELKKILSLNNNNWVLFKAQEVPGLFGAPAYYIAVGPKNNMQPTNVYLIDTSFHSVYNPISVQDLTNPMNQTYEGLYQF